MAYFPNWTSSEGFNNQCQECIHEDELALCPIAYVHWVYNYNQCDGGQEKLRGALNILVSDDGECQMKPLIDKLRVKR